MSSIKDLKKSVKKMVIAILDDCDYIMESGGKNADKADKLIDQAVDFHDEMIAKINKANTKADFRSLKEEIEKKAVEFVDALNALN